MCSKGAHGRRVLFGDGAGAGERERELRRRGETEWRLSFSHKRAGPGALLNKTAQRRAGACRLLAPQRRGACSGRLQPASKPYLASGLLMYVPCTFYGGQSDMYVPSMYIHCIQRPGQAGPS